VAPSSTTISTACSPIVPIRRRIRERFRTRSVQTFYLLEAIERDCVGAVQILPPEDEPNRWNRVDAAPLTETNIKQLLSAVTVPPAHTPR
jgi:serine/threonine-protein kinase HipA